jgi:hypothetical protein
LLYYLRKFTKNNFLDLEYNLYWNEKNFNKIINELNIYYKNSNIKEIIDIIYFEWFYFENPDYINNFLNLIKIDLIKNNLKNKIMIWNNIDNWINIDKINKEIKKLNYLIYSNFWNFLFKKIKSNNKELSTLWVIWFIEWISQQVSNNDNMKNLRKLLFYSELQNWLDDVNNFWQWVNN